MEPFDLRDFLARLPRRPGVYRMIGADDAVLYVGKARDLKKRVSSHFTRSQQSPRIAHMLERVARVEATVARPEAGARLRGNGPTKTGAPRCSPLFRGDRSCPYLRLAGRAVPRSLSYRGAADKRGRYFGPYPSAWSVREA